MFAGYDSEITKSNESKLIKIFSAWSRGMIFASHLFYIAFVNGPGFKSVFIWK